MLAVEQPPEPRNSKHKAYAFGRSVGMTPAEACRRAGGNVDFGQATKWERQKSVQSWINYFRSLGHTEEMLAEKRRLIEQRLEMAAYGNIFEFATMAPDGKDFIVDWNKVADSPYGVIISGFKFDKDTGRLSDFERDNALQAISQLRDMHGFKAPAKTAFTDPTGKQEAQPFVVEIVRFSDGAKPADKAPV